jgi:DNA ligase 1
MQFSQLAQYLQRLEETTKRLEITSILADLIKEVDTNEIANTLYLSLGYLKAEFESERFNIAEKMMYRILAASYGETEEKIKELYSRQGDLGTVAFDINPNKQILDADVNYIHEILMEIAQTEGTGSQDKKIQLASELLGNTSKLSSKYLVRIILGTTRLGFTELTVVDALAQFVNGGEKAPKELKKQIESKYRIHPDIGRIAERIKAKGLDGLSEVDMEVGVPVHAQMASRLDNPVEIIEKMNEVWVEYKFDGTRTQLHMDKDKKMEVASFEQQGMFDVQKEMTFIKTFTRNLEETTHQFPDIIAAANQHLDAKSVILDGEAIGYNKDTGEFLPFQETIQRKRKHGITQAAKDIPLKYMVFDLIYLDGKSLVDTPFVKRREMLKKIVKPNDVIQIDTNIQTTNPEELATWHKEAMDKGLEGVMIKQVDSPYEAGARNFKWVKLKKLEEQILNDTVECVILGYYHGRGARSKFGIGGFLVGLWDEKDGEFKTITKVGSGLTDEGWHNLKKRCDLLAIPNKAAGTDIGSKYDCDVWTKPEIVVEIAADELSKSSEHSAGYALRFPRMIKYRDDKKPKQTTTIKEIKQMYEAQTK